MSNSKLVDYVKLSPNYNKRTNKIKKITIHHMAGNLSVEACGKVFSRASRQASSNYGIGTDGRVGMYVEECNRSWCSSNKENDHQAITIEVANDGGKPNWHVSDKALDTLIELCTDICKRNGIKKLEFTGDKTGNLTLHKMFAATTCPGPYLESKIPFVVTEVNKRLGVEAEEDVEVVDDTYLVKVTADELNVRAGAGTGYKVTAVIKDKGVYTIVEEKLNGRTLWGKLKSGKGWISLKYTERVK